MISSTTALRYKGVNIGIRSLHSAFRCSAGRLRFFIVLVTLHCVSLSAIAQIISIPLTGDNTTWQFRMFGDTLWHSALTPGTVHTDLISNQMIPDPFIGSNEDSVQWVEKQDWEYQVFFVCPDSMINQTNIELQLEGLDTYADVYLNDTLILEADNMFRNYSVNVRRIIQSNRNHLFIHFYSAINKGYQQVSTLPYQMAGDVDGKAFIRKAQYQYGWDWGPRLLTCGIWKPIHLRAWSGYMLQQALISLDSLTTDTAYLSIKARIHSTTEKKSAFTFSNDATAEASTAVFNLKQGINDFSIPLKIAQPQLWWCNGLGPQKLYDLKLSIDDPVRSILYQVKYGIRTIQLLQEKDTIGSGFGFELNGIPVFMKGANYIPPDNFLPRVAKMDYERIVDDAVECNMNMLRVWGGGVYAADDFYELCDKKGILIWQDFMFAGTMVPGDSAFIKNIKEEVTDNVVRLRNHPCLALWCGNNEIDEAWHNWGWQEQYHYDSDTQQKLWNDYQHLFHVIIPGLLNEFDPQSNYVTSSPSIGWGHKESLQQGDAHYWGVWWGDEPFNVYSRKVGRFMSEYGFQALPAMSTISRFTSMNDRILQNTGKNKFSAVLNMHEKHPTGFEKIDTYLERAYRTPKDFESYVYTSQLLQRDGITTAIEAHRRSKPYCQGTLYWQLNDCWPVVSWSSRDYFGTWKALQYAVRDLYKPYMISVVKEERYYKVYIVSDSLADVTGLLELELHDFNGTKLMSAEKIITVAANQSQLVFAMDEKKLSKNFAMEKSVLTANFSAGNHLLAEKNYFFTQPKDLSLSQVIIEQKITYLDDQSGFADYPYQYQIELSTGKLAKDILLECKNQDVKFRDNFFDLLPHQAKSTILFSKNKIDVADLSIVITSLVDSY